MNASFNTANQAKLALKMKCSAHHWYRGSWVENDGDEYIVVISVAKVDDALGKIIPKMYDGVSIKTMQSK